MKINKTLFTALISGALACGPLIAGPLRISITNPDTSGRHDSLQITLDPADGALHGLAGSTVGWGFTAVWTSDSGDWVTFNSSSLGSPDAPQTNPSILAAGGYADYIGVQQGPNDGSLNSDPGTWTQPYPFSSTGVGAYEIAADAEPGAFDTGRFTFSFQIYDGQPGHGGTQIGQAFYSYYGTDTAYSVTVDNPAGDAPEPSTWLLLSSGAGLVGLFTRRRRAA